MDTSEQEAAWQEASLWRDAPEFGRRDTMIEALSRLYQVFPAYSRIVELGTSRDSRCAAMESDGWSTVAFGYYASQVAAHVFTVDIDAVAIEECKALTDPYYHHIEYVIQEGIRFLMKWLEHGWNDIHFLYLDSYDYHSDPPYSEYHHLVLAALALCPLARRGFIMVDDTAAENDGARWVGKGARAVPFLLRHGFELIFARDNQVLLQRR